MSKPNTETQLEIAAHWLDEAAREFSALGRHDYSANCKRVSEQSRAILKQNKEAQP